MTAPATSSTQEADQVSTAYKLALAYLGTQAVAEALSIWQTYPATAKAAQSSRWLAQVAAMVASYRAKARQLGRAYYRLHRALLTGSTISDPARPDEPSYITLGDLRDQFQAVLAGDRAGATPAPTGGADPSKPIWSPDGPAGGRDAGVKVHVDPIANQDRDEQLIERAAELETKNNLQTLGPRNLDGKTAKLDTTQAAKVVDQQRNEAHAAAGKRQAAAAARIVENGARSETWANQEKDAKAIGWVRYSRTGTPCGWCAMLISRGPVYRSAASADYSDGDAYHDNCHCVAIPVYSQGQYASSELFALNRLYAEQWPKVTAGLGGESALSAWRAFIRREQAKPTLTVVPKAA